MSNAAETGLTEAEQREFRPRCARCGSEDVFVNWSKQRERGVLRYYPGAMQCRRCFGTIAAPTQETTEL